MSADSAGKTGCQNQGGIAVAPSLCGLGLFCVHHRAGRQEGVSQVGVFRMFIHKY